MNRDDGVVTIERWIDATPETVFSFFADPGRWLSWQGVTAEVDPRPGGTFRMNVRGDGYATGEFVLIDPGERIVLTWGWENEALEVPPGSSIVELTFAAERGGTLVRLRHAGLPPEALAPHREGWTHYVGRLAVRAAGDDPGPDPTLVAPSFAFPPDTLDFLAELRGANDKAWFDANRTRYQAAYVDAGKAFVEAVAPVLAGIVPGVHAEPRVSGSIFRINRDTRFSADKRPYKDHLDFWFWHGDRKAAVSGLFVRVSPDVVVVGAGSHGFDKPALGRFRAAVCDDNARAELAEAVEAIEKTGYPVDGQTHKRVPAGYPVGTEGPAARFLRHSALFVHHDEAADLALDAGHLLPTLGRHWNALAPLHRWLVTHVQQPWPTPATPGGRAVEIPKPTEADKDLFRSLVPDDPRVEIKPMFGNLGAFVNGNMFMGLFGADVGVKLRDADREALLAEEGAGPFGPEERPMAGYVTLPAAWHAAPASAEPWIAKAFDHVGSLPAKTKKSKKK
jgi:uncharacterized protein (TIGR02453 family)